MALLKNKKIALILYIFVFTFALFNIGAQSAQAASLYFSPASGSHTIGQIFTTSVYVSSSDQAINAASGIISFPKDKLEVISLSKAGSIVSLWTQEPSFSNTNGTINFEGIALNPGYQGSAGKIISVQFRIKQIGQVNLNITNGSILANDGLGTQILSNISGATFQINPKITEPIASISETPIEKIGVPLAPKITCSTHPDPDKWYISETAKFSWQLPQGVDAVRISINQISNAKPTVTYIPTINSKEITDLEEGIWYFHAQLKNEYGWGDISHFRIQIDKTPPQSLTIQVDNGGDSTNPQPSLHFEAKDSLSGTEYYEIKIGQIHNLKVSADEVKNGYYKIPVTPPGKYSIIIRAIDKAGNYSLAMTEIDIEPIEAPIITDCPKTLYPGNPLILKGKSLSKTTVSIFIRNERKEIITDVATSDERGHWALTLARTLDRGIYEIWAQTTDYRGAKSDYSNKLRIVISPPIFLRIGNLVINYLSVVISLIALTISMAMIWVYAWRKMKLLQKKLKKETIEAEESLSEAFNILRKKTKNEIAKLDGQVGLSKKEEEVNKELKKAFKISEKLIAKEIKDIKEKIDKS
jgi:hypothetical protein